MRQKLLDDAVLLALLQSDDNVREAIQASLTNGPLRDRAPSAFRDIFQPARAALSVRVLLPSQDLAGSGFIARDQAVIDRNMELGYNDYLKSGFLPVGQT